MDNGMFDLSGRVAMVTAGGRGLGREMCEVMAEYGADVACCDIDMGRAQETVDSIKESGCRAIAIQADVSKPSDVERMVDKTLAEFTTINILFNNAGIVNPPARLHELKIEDWGRVIDVCLNGMFLVTRAVLPVMLKNKKGSIINTSSAAGVRGGCNYCSLPDGSAYGAAKHGVIGLTRHAALAYAKDGIRVNAIAPGSFRTWNTSISRELQAAIYDSVAKATPMGTVGEPSEIKGIAVYLASDASSYVTGATFRLDGGLTA